MTVSYLVTKMRGAGWREAVHGAREGDAHGDGLAVMLQLRRAAVAVRVLNLIALR